MSIFSLMELINTISVGALGMFVFLKGSTSIINRKYALFCFFVTMWSFCYFIWSLSNAAIDALLWNRALMGWAIFIPVTFLHFVYSLLYGEKRVDWKKTITIIYSIFLVFLALDFTSLFIKSVGPKLSFEFWPNPGMTFLPFFILWIGCCLYTVYILLVEHGKATGIKREQIKYLTIGICIGYFGGATNYFLWLNISMFPYGNILMPICIGFMAYAIVAYRLMDMQIVIARSFILLGVYSFVLLVIAWLWYPMRPVLQMWLGAKWFFVPLFTFAGLSMIAPFVYLHYQQKYDQRRLRRQRAQLANLKQITATSIDIDHEQLLKNIPPFLMQMYRDDFQTDIDCISVYYYEKNQDAYRLVSYKTKKSDISFEPTILKTDPIPSWFTEKAPRFAKEGLLDTSYLEAFKYEDLDYYQSKQTDKVLIHAITALKDNMKNLKADVCVACFYKNDLLAFLLMGKKQRGGYTQEELDTFSLLAHDVASNIKSGELRDELEQSYIDAIHAIITALEERDSYTKGHSERVVQYSVLIADELKDVFPFTRIFNLADKVRRAALLHDVGKIGVPDAILLKPSKLTDEEYTRLKEHPKTSLYIVQSIKNISEEIRDGIESHHEKYDGTGYGKGSKGHHVPPIARIIAVADTFDAMTSDRPYRKAKTEKIAIEEINRVSGTQFDPKVVDAFNRVYGKGKLLKKH